MSSKCPPLRGSIVCCCIMNKPQTHQLLYKFLKLVVFNFDKVISIILLDNQMFIIILITSTSQFSGLEGRDSLSVSIRDC